MVLLIFEFSFLITTGVESDEVILKGHFTL